MSLDTHIFEIHVQFDIQCNFDSDIEPMLCKCADSQCHNIPVAISAKLIKASIKKKESPILVFVIHFCTNNITFIESLSTYASLQTFMFTLFFKAIDS